MRNWILILLSLFLFQINIFSQSSPQPSEVFQLMEKADQKYSKKKYRSSRNLMVKAITKDWEFVEQFMSRTDHNFSKIKNKKRHWKKVESAFGGAMKGINQNLRNELIAINKDDQKYRKEIHELYKSGQTDSPKIAELGKKQDEIDTENLEKVEAIISKHGYPSKSLVGRKAGKSVFYVIQHSDLKTQEKYLPLFEKAVASGDLKMKSLALMIDRILMGNGKPQIYGTQLKTDKESNKPYVYQVVDAKNLNKRRSAIGLQSIEEYIERFGGKFSNKAKILSNKDFKRFLGTWELVHIRKAETFEILFTPERYLWIRFNKKGRMEFNRDVNRCQIPFQAEANGNLRLSKLSSCSKQCCDNEDLKKTLNYHNINRFEMYDKQLFLMDTDGKIWEFRKGGLEKRRIKRN